MRASATRLLLVVALVFSHAGCGALARVQEPAFAIRAKDGDFELRHYDERVVATTRVEGEWSKAGSEGFRRLAGYIFGKNRRATSIAMTAPVGQRQEIPMTAPVGQRREGNVWLVTFTMPAGSTLESLPTPEDPRVVLERLPPLDVAVVRFSGFWTVANVNEQTAALRAWVASRGLETAGEPEVNRFDPPFKPWFLRRNEVWLPLVATSR